jgi:hypothetical protein
VEDGPISKLTTCPSCGKQVEALEKVQIGTKLALRESESDPASYEAVCKDCLKKLSRLVSHGAKLLADKKQKEIQRSELWKNRTNFVRQGRALMKQKAFSKSALAYEKYLRILELIFKVGSGQLTPDLLHKEGRSKEITVITSVYWDLLRIYDTSTQYKERQEKAAKKLAQFSPHSAAYRDVVKRAENFAKRAKNKSAVDLYLRNVRLTRPRCFIATSVFEDGLCREVRTLRCFRDQELRCRRLGRHWVFFYYRLSPPLARWLDRQPTARTALRPLLRGLAWLLAHTFNLPTRTEF